MVRAGSFHARALALQAGTGLFLFTIVFAPIPYGSVGSGSVSALTFALSLSLVLLSCAVARLDVHRAFIAVPLLLCLAATALIILQEAVIPWNVSSPLWERNFAIWHKTSALLETRLPPRIAIAADHGFSVLASPFSMVLAFWNALLLGVDSRRGLTFLRWLAAAGLAFALYALLAFMLFPDMLLGGEKRFYLGNLTGTFVNRNTAATFFGSMTIVWFALLLPVVRSSIDDRPAGTTWSAALASPSRGVVRRSLASILCLLATVLTGSRAGSFLTVLALPLTGFLFFHKEWRALSLRQWGGWMLAFSTFLLLLSVWGGALATRLSETSLSNEGRFTAYHAISRILVDHPLLGIGIGSFPDIIPLYREPGMGMRGIWDLAHNTILEIAATAGLPLAIMIAAFWLWTGWRLWRAARNAPGTQARLLLCAGSGVWLLATLHSLVDFSLQIPGFGVVFATFAGLAAGQIKSARDCGSNRDSV